MYQKVSVLIIEDEKSICDFMNKTLTAAGYKVATAATGKEGLASITSLLPDVVLLDLGLPDMDGFDIIKKTREWSSLPIIVVSARSTEKEKVASLDAGADDYVTKPFSVNVLLARIKANLRRTANEVIIGERNTSVLQVRDLVIDNEKYLVTKAGEPISLSKIEYDLLAFLAANQGKPFKREELLESVWGYKEFFGDRRTVDVTVSRLRNKLESDPTHPEYIFSKHGYGYYLA